MTRLGEAAVCRVLRDARVGDSLKIAFCAGTGRRGLMTAEARVALLRFVGLADLFAGPAHMRFQFGYGLTQIHAPALILAAAQSGFWDGCSRLWAVRVLKEVCVQDADFFGARIVPVLEDFTLVEKNR